MFELHILKLFTHCRRCFCRGKWWIRWPKKVFCTLYFTLEPNAREELQTSV